MKSTGIVRKVDELGRIVIPKELRVMLSIDVKDPVEVFTEGDTIILKIYEPTCTFCGEVNNTTSFNGKLICKKCIENLVK